MLADVLDRGAMADLSDKCAAVDQCAVRFGGIFGSSATGLPPAADILKIVAELWHRAND